MEAALEQYLILAKNAKGKACEALIYQAIANPKTFVFGELIDAVQGGGISEECQKVLDIFAYGTLKDYRNAGLPELSPQQLKKLQMLTLATLASTKSILEYGELQQVLEINSARQLEDLIVESIYEGLIKGKLDNKNSCLRVFECFGRDLRPNELPEVIGKIKNYLENVNHIEKVIIENLDYLQQSKNLRQEKKLQFDSIFKEQKDSVKASINQSPDASGILAKIKRTISGKK